MGHDCSNANVISTDLDCLEFFSGSLKTIIYRQNKNLNFYLHSYEDSKEDKNLHEKGLHS